MLDLNARFWEMLAMKMPMVANHVPDADTFFVDEEDYLGFDTIDDAEAQCLRLLDDEGLRETIAQTGHKKVVDGHHSYDDRVQTILETVGLI